MKAIILVGAAALALSACADLTNWTGITAEQQQCIALAAVTEAQKDTPMADKIASVELACGVSRTALIETAIRAAMAGLEE
jgi:hypothetical protein